MNDDRADQDLDNAAPESADMTPTGDEPTDGGKGDEYDEAVAAADDTGMVSGEQLITKMEIERGLRGE